MSLELLLNIICDLAIKRNLVNYSAAGPSIYRLNDETIKDYPFIFASPTNNVVTRKNFTDYTLTLFYVDRLLLDSANETHIFSIANDTLVNLLRQLKQLEGIVDVSEPTVRLFTETERMADRCAGGYTDVTITVLNDAECPVIMDETGEMIGTYIPNTLKDLNVLDNLASKPWVQQYVADITFSGGTDEKEVKRLINQALTAYTKTDKFATINGSGITNNEVYNLLERDVFREFLSGYTQDKENIYAAISAATPEDYETLSGTVVGNVAKIADLSAFTSGLSFTVNEHTENIEQISALTQTLSGETSDLRAFLGDLSGFTSSAVSSITEGLETLSGATVALSGATVGIESDLADLSSGLTDLSAATSGLTVLVDGKQDALTAGENITIENNVISAAGNVSSTSVFTIWSGSQAEYTALGTYDNNTLYVIKNANT